MATVSASEVKELRERTGAGMLDCKKALEETGGDMEAAIDLLRTRGAAKAAKRSSKEAAEGAVAVHVDGRAAGIVELNCETDFVARTDEFQELARELAAHVASEAAETRGGETAEALVDQAFRGGGKTVSEVVTAVSAKTGEKIVVRRYARFDAEAGTLGSYVHMNGRIGVLVELDGGAGDDLAKDVAMHIAASRPLAVTPEELPEDVVERERAIYAEQVRAESKPENIRERIVEGKLQRFYKENALLEQPFVRDPETSVGALLQGSGAEVRRFVRFAIGE